ncbi:MAG: YgaP family membrane protein [Anaerolineaceae bacterium]
MKTNESGLDRIIRVVVGAALLVLYFTQVVAGGLGIVSVVIGAVLLITGIVGFCPLYALLKIQTNK